MLLGAIFLDEGVEGGLRCHWVRVEGLVEAELFHIVSIEVGDHHLSLGLPIGGEELVPHEPIHLIVDLSLGFSPAALGNTVISPSEKSILLVDTPGELCKKVFVF